MLTISNKTLFIIIAFALFMIALAVFLGSFGGVVTNILCLGVVAILALFFEGVCRVVEDGHIG